MENEILRQCTDCDGKGWYMVPSHPAVEDVRKNMLDVLSQYQSELDYLAITLDERELSVMVRELIRKTLAAKLKGLPL